VFYRDLKTLPMIVFGTSENFEEGTQIPMLSGRFFNGTEVQYRTNVAVIGNTPYQVLFAASGTDPIGKTIRVGNDRFEIIGVFDKRPSAGGFNLGQDDFVVMPYTVYQRIFGLRGVFVGRGGNSGLILPIQIAMLPRDGVLQADAIADIERVMRIRHGLRLDEPNDFEVLTQDAVLKLWDQVSQGTFLALIVMSSIALMVGGIGVMAIMSISVTERTREIGVRKALGARRAEILFQFLMEAAFLTSLGGVLGILLGSGIGWAVHLITGFPISLPWWSFAIGLGFSASVGIFFGMYPAFKASRLDPIEALRYE
jgi:putative ABC transport system permease protein